MPAIKFTNSPTLEWGGAPASDSIALMNATARALVSASKQAKAQEREDMWRAADLALKRESLAARGGSKAKDRAELARKVLLDEGYMPGTHDPETVAAARQTLGHSLDAAAPEPLLTAGRATAPVFNTGAMSPGSPAAGGTGLDWSQPVPADPMPALRRTLEQTRPTGPAPTGLDWSAPTTPGTATLTPPVTQPVASSPAMPVSTLPPEATMTDEDIRLTNRARLVPPEMEYPDWFLDRPLMFGGTNPQTDRLLFSKDDVGREKPPRRTLRELLEEQEVANLSPADRVRHKIGQRAYREKYGGGVEVSDEELADLTSPDPERAKTRLLSMIQRAKTDPGYAVNLRGLVNALRNAGVTIPGSQGEYQQIAGQ